MLRFHSIFKGLKYTSLIFIIWLFVKCSSDSIADLEPLIDCESSNLSLQIELLSSASCAKGGQITISPSGGEPPYMYSINDNDFQSANTFSDIPAGSFVASVMDSKGCVFTKNGFLDANDEAITIELETISSGCNQSNGVINISADGGDENFQYTLFQEGTLLLESTDSSFNNLLPGDYTVSVQDGGGCGSEKEISLLTGISLESNIFPLIETNCAISGCHLDSQQPLYTDPSIVRDFANQIANRVSSQSPSRVMPPSGSLPQNEIDQILCWVNDGSPDN